MFGQERLGRGIATTKSEETNAVMIKVYFGPNKAVRPVWINEKPMAEKRSETLIVGATNEDDRTCGMSVQIEADLNAAGDRPSMHAGSVARL